MALRFLNMFLKIYVLHRLKKMSNFYFGSLDIATLPEPLLFSTTGVYFGKIWLLQIFEYDRSCIF